ncbi:F-box domain-containing protein [Mycena kentingensis (nom. inval.)]|nr:F-box domain-containing protein [Mycena kentingensis (nom. inval.)]
MLGNGLPHDTTSYSNHIHTSTHLRAMRSLETIPNELLCTIFTECLPPPPIAPSPQTAPMLLTQVCSHWRAVAFAAPELWSSLAYARKFNLNVPSDPFLNAWLGRAQSQPVLLDLAAAYAYGNRVPFSAELFRPILRSVANLHGLRIGSPIAGFSEAAQKVSAPTIRSLTVVHGVLAAALAWLDLPGLIHLDTYASIEIPELRAFLALPGTHLTKLTIHITRRTREDELVELLGDLGTLVYLCVDEQRDVWTMGHSFLELVASAAAPSLLPRLEELVINTSSRCLKYPALVDFLRLCRDGTASPVLRSMQVVLTRYNDLDDAMDTLLPPPTACLDELLRMISGGFDLSISTIL